jgi:uncharacterized membrane protein YeaQ/YmgE (transglycosylase-associated protein family)
MPHPDKIRLSFLRLSVETALLVNSGFIGSKIVTKQGEGMFLDILLGIVGAIAGVVETQT